MTSYISENEFTTLHIRKSSSFSKVNSCSHLVKFHLAYTDQWWDEHKVLLGLFYSLLF